MTTNNQNSLDAIFDEFMNGNPPFANDYSKVQAQAFVDYLRPKLSAAINKTIMEDMLAMIGPDVKIVYEKDDEGARAVGRKVGERVRMNRYKAQLRQKVNKKFGRGDDR